MLEDTTPVSETPDYEIHDIPDCRRGTKTITVDSGTYQISKAHAAIAELLLQTDTPLTIKQIEEQSGFTNASNAINTLRQIGMIHSYQKGDAHRPVYHMASATTEPRDVPDTFQTYVRRTRDHFKGSVDIAPVTKIILDPVHDPDPSLLDVPYISLPAHASADLIMRMKGSKETAPTDLSAVAFLKDYFEKGGRNGFEQAHDHKGNQGRWVFVGFETNATLMPEKSTEEAQPKFHPNTNDMIMG